jgi:hypothetical protein
LSVLRYELAEGPAFLLVEPCDGIFEALRLAREHGVATCLVDRDSDAYVSHDDALPDPHAIERIGYDEYVARVSAALSGKTSPEDELREATMAFHLSRLSERYERVLFVCGLAHVARMRDKLERPVARPLGRTKRAGVQVFHLHSESSREVLSEPGHVQGLFEAWRTDSSRPDPPPQLCDRYALGRELLLDARSRMHREDGEKLAPQPIRVALQFARNQALARAALAPDLYELTIAARGVASDDFAWHVWDIGVSYRAERVPISPSTASRRRATSGAWRLWFRAVSRRAATRPTRPHPQKEPAPGAWGEPREPHLQLPSRGRPHRDLRVVLEKAREKLDGGRARAGGALSSGLRRRHRPARDHQEHDARRPRVRS